MLAAAAIVALIVPRAMAQPAGTFTVLHAFEGVDGSTPVSVLQATDGNFYGTTASGGPAPSSGTVFRMTPAGDLAVLHTFSGTDGLPPNSLIQAADGNLYGTTPGDTGTGAGNVFELTLPGGPPAITTQPVSQTIASGQTASMSVVASVVSEQHS
jgi:uncharacterized repeat protein (TIGR03803 family)